MLPGIPANSHRVSTFKILEDSIALRAALQSGQIATVGLVGARPHRLRTCRGFYGYVGCSGDSAQAAPQILPAMLDTEMARAVETYLSGEGVEVRTNCPLQGIVESEKSVTLKTPQGDFVVDHAVIAIRGQTEH